VGHLYSEPPSLGSRVGGKRPLCAVFLVSLIILDRFHSYVTLAGPTQAFP
ncbi:MAG: hypothetical protein ACI9VX_002380, partial [Dinoroseobacter sp.]